VQGRTPARNQTLPRKMRRKTSNQYFRLPLAATIDAGEIDVV
jgi:hypothetical protein